MLPSDRLGDAQELCLWLAGTAERRHAKRERIRELAERADYNLLAGALLDRRMLALMGGRLEEIAGDAVPAAFREYTTRSALHTGRRATLFAATTHRLLTSLERHGVTALALKGPLLAERIYANPSVRGTVDIDLLVQPGDFARTTEILTSEGYGPAEGSPWYGDLPLFEATLHGQRPGLPKVDLHWRIHWYESEFSARLIERSVRGPDGTRFPHPTDELAAMLLYYARDAFWGLRLPTDIGAWWDAHGTQLEQGALDQVISDHPKLQAAILSAALVAQRVSGLPAHQVVSIPYGLVRMPPRAHRLVNWDGSGDGSEQHSSLVLLDWLLTPRGDRKLFVARHFLPPPSAIARIYSLPENAPVRARLRRLYYGIRAGMRLLPRAVGATWRTRRGREWFPLPS